MEMMMKTNRNLTRSIDEHTVHSKCICKLAGRLSDFFTELLKAPEALGKRSPCPLLSLYMVNLGDVSTFGFLFSGGQVARPGGSSCKLYCIRKAISAKNDWNHHLG